MYVYYFQINTLGKGVAFHLIKIESPLPKDVLCQIWLKLTQSIEVKFSLTEEKDQNVKRFVQTDIQTDERTKRHATRNAHLSYHLNWSKIW